MRRLATLLAAVAVLSAACAGGDSGDGVASLEATPTTLVTVDVEVDREETLLEFTQCLRDNGVDVEDPTVDADGNIQLTRPGGGPGSESEVDREAARDARQAGEYLLEGVTLGTRNRDDSEFQDLLLEFAQCMRDEGIDMPDPDFATGTPGGPFGELDRSDSAFQAGIEVCGEILAGFGPGEGGQPPGGRGGGG
ncbi:MAG: hypothetical protein KJN71_01305 [Acidimicrobiia bacterium]|nr:hypothetical protein [Acidimicrobiia bacterium]